MAQSPAEKVGVEPGGRVGRGNGNKEGKQEDHDIDLSGTYTVKFKYNYSHREKNTEKKCGSVLMVVKNKLYFLYILLGFSHFQKQHDYCIFMIWNNIPIVFDLSAELYCLETGM